MIEEVKAILSGWDNVRVEDNGAYWLVSGSYQGQAHAGTRADPVSLAHDLVQLAGSWVEPEPVDAYQQHWDTVTAGKLVDAVPFVDPLAAENGALRARIAELEAALAAPVLELSNPAEPPAEALDEAYPDEDHAALKARILAEFASLRNMLIGQIPMTQDQLARLVALEHPKYQSWLQGVTNGN
jgi:hypothetical protein